MLPIHRELTVRELREALSQFADDDIVQINGMHENIEPLELGIAADDPNETDMKAHFLCYARRNDGMALFKQQPDGRLIRLNPKFFPKEES